MYLTNRLVKPDPTETRYEPKKGIGIPMTVIPMKLQIAGTAANKTIYSLYKVATSVDSPAMTGHSCLGLVRMLVTLGTRSIEFNSSCTLCKYSELCFWVKS